jgi:hypothetical protein
MSRRRPLQQYVWFWGLSLMVAPQVGLLEVADQKGVGRGTRAVEVDDILTLMEGWMKRCGDGVVRSLVLENRKGNTE